MPSQLFARGPMQRAIYEAKALADKRNSLHKMGFHARTAAGSHFPACVLWFDEWQIFLVSKRYEGARTVIASCNSPKRNLLFAKSSTRRIYVHMQ